MNRNLLSFLWESLSISGLDSLNLHFVGQIYTNLIQISDIILDQKILFLYHQQLTNIFYQHNPIKKQLTFGVLHSQQTWQTYKNMRVQIISKSSSILLITLITQISSISVQPNCNNIELTNSTFLVQTKLLSTYMFVDGNDQGICQTLRQKYEHNRDIIELLVSFVRDGSVFVHAGAHVGVETIVVAKYAQMSGYGNFRVFAFQPNQLYYVLLTKSVYINDLQDMVTVVKAAVTDKIGQAEMAIRNIDTSAAQIVQDTTTKRKADYKYNVKTITLDSYLCQKLRENDKISVMYISTNTMEIEVLLGMSNILESQKEDMVILIDWQYGRNPRKNIDAIINIFNGFKGKKYGVYEVVMTESANIEEIRQIHDLKQLIAVKAGKVLLLPNNMSLPKLNESKLVYNK